MPIFEFVCRECDEPFEELVRAGERVTCPRCKSARLEKRFSTFAATSEASAQPTPPGSCGTCGDPRGPGACRRE